MGVVIHADATCAVDDRSCAHESEDRRHSLRNPLTDQGAGLPPHGPHSADRARRPFAGVSGPSSPRRPSTAAAPVMGSAPRLWCFKPSRLLDIVSSVDDGWISVVLGSADREFGSQLARRVIADVGAIYGAGPSMACAETTTLRFVPTDFRDQGSDEQSRRQPNTPFMRNTTSVEGGQQTAMITSRGPSGSDRNGDARRRGGAVQRWRGMRYRLPGAICTGTSPW